MATHKEGCCCLRIADFNKVYKSCISVQAKWYTLATYLDVERTTVEAIESSEKDPAKCLGKVLSAWLKRSSPTQPKPSWRSLCDALAGMGEVALSETIQREHPCGCEGEHPCGCDLCKVTRATPVSMAVRQENAVDAATELKKDFKELLAFLTKEIRKVDTDELRLRISDHFQEEEGNISDEIEKHLTKIEDYSTPNAVLNYFCRHRFIGYINYYLVKIFQALAKSPLLDKRVEEYEKDYQCFLKLSLTQVHNTFQRYPDLRPDYPAGIPKFTIHLESEWDGKSVFELKEFLNQCFNNSDCIDQLMITKISRNCIIVTFAVLPHITRTVLHYLTNDDVISTLKKEGITVNISKQLLKYQQKATEEKGTMTTDSITTEIPSKLQAEQKLQDQPPLAGMLSLKPGWDVTSDSGHTGSIGDTEGAGDQRLIDELREDVLLKEAVDAYEYDRNRLKRQIKALEVQLQIHKNMEFELDQTKDELQHTKLSLTKLRDMVQPGGVSEDKLNKELFWAVRFGDEKRAKTLIDSGAYINASNDEGETPLLIASYHGHVEIIKLLISHGAIVDAVSSKDLRNGWTPLHYASFKGHTAVVQVLFSHGATVDRVNYHSETPLYLASDQGHSETVECLISHGARVDKQDEDSETPLYIASRNGHSDVVNILLSHGATVDIKDNMGRTPLYVASSSGHSDVVSILLSHKATVDIKDNEGETPLHRAASNNNDNVVGILLSHGATVSTVDKHLRTPLHHCLVSTSYYQNVDATVGLLISNGADLYQEDKYNQSPVLIVTVLGREHLLLSHSVSEDTIAKYRLPRGWRARNDYSDRIIYTNTATGREQYTHPLFQ